MAALCEIYWYPIYAFIRRHGHGEDAAKDLTQAFFALVLEKRYFLQADPARGCFRAFLSASIRHFLSNERDRTRAHKRGGGQRMVSLEWEAAEQRYRLEPRDDMTPERLFDHHWGVVLLERVLARLAQEYAAQDKQRLFDALRPHIAGSSELPYRDTAAAVEMTEGAFKVAVHRFRKRYRALLTEEIGETVTSPEDIEAEIRYLLKAVSV